MEKPLASTAPPPVLSVIARVFDRYEACAKLQRAAAEGEAARRITQIAVRRHRQRPGIDGRAAQIAVDGSERQRCRRPILASEPVRGG